tara:strand:+ start:3570 stop:4043 length:474 start_codon:yes stop_codon:yes gene_type:complete
MEVYIDLLVKFRINEKQLNFAYMKLLGLQPLEYKYLEESNEKLSSEEAEDLLVKNILYATSENGLHFDNLTLTTEFKRKLFKIYPSAIFEEYWGNYPKKIDSVKNNEINHESLRKSYLDRFSNDIEGHELLMDAMNNLKENGNDLPAINTFFKNNSK